MPDASPANLTYAADLVSALVERSANVRRAVLAGGTESVTTLGTAANPSVYKRRRLITGQHPQALLQLSERYHHAHAQPTSRANRLANLERTVEHYRTQSALARGRDDEELAVHCDAMADAARATLRAAERSGSWS